MMRHAIPVLTLVVALFGCEATKPSAAKGAGGAASGLPTGKRQHKPITVSDPAQTELAEPSSPAPSEPAPTEVTAEAEATKPATIKSPRDAASGMATGKRQHKPIN